MASTAREPIRLVIWDLDDTFWHGTLSEGGIDAYLAENHEIVITLARRGILSSICSKNDFETVKPILERYGIFEYFIFPSIDWTAKGPRIAAIIDAVQLRPPTVLFIDDNPSNLAEAAAVVPGLQTALPSVLDGLLEDPLFAGKDDSGLTRLRQYKVLEQRAVDRSRESDDLSFLRSSGVRVVIDTDVEAQLDRTIELINRTNQLNFTKRRLPENLAQARAQLCAELRPFYVRSGLIRVMDHYGDYGYCGFYRLEGDHLMDYCFSCRILGMGVERWLYARLGRPVIAIAGEVVSDLEAGPPVDWITLQLEADQPIERVAPSLPEVRLRGGCELDALAHYFQLVAEAVRCETNRHRGPLFVRMDSVFQLLPSLGDPDHGFLNSMRDLGFADEDFRSSFLSPARPGTLLIYSPWADNYLSVFHHAAKGYTVGLDMGVYGDVTAMTEAEIEAELVPLALEPEPEEERRQLIGLLRAGYRFELYPSLDFIIDSIKRVFDRIPTGSRLFFILPYEFLKEEDGLVPRPGASRYNEAVRSLAKSYPNVCLLPMNDVVASPDEVDTNFDHFDRIVYFRIYEWIARRLADEESAGVSSGA